MHVEATFETYFKEIGMTQTQPQFKPGDRVFTHYDMKWGTVERINTTYRDQTHGVTGSKLPDTTWYDVKYDDGNTSLLDDAHGNWDMARIVPPHIAKRFGYGDDPCPNPDVEPLEAPCCKCGLIAYAIVDNEAYCPRCIPEVTA